MKTSTIVSGGGLIGLIVLAIGYAVSIAPKATAPENDKRKTSQEVTRLKRKAATGNNPRIKAGTVGKTPCQLATDSYVRIMVDELTKRGTDDQERRVLLKDVYRQVANECEQHEWSPG